MMNSLLLLTSGFRYVLLVQMDNIRLLRSLVLLILLDIENWRIGDLEQDHLRSFNNRVILAKSWVIDVTTLTSGLNDRVLCVVGVN